jgi:Mn2+/Fe2+ NRAMP family transporter
MLWNSVFWDNGIQIYGNRESKEDGMQATPDKRVDGVAAEPKVPTSWTGYFKAMGPGLVVSLMWLGTGDLINSSVSGATYGYALMWGLAVALFCRYFFVTAMAKYQLCNSQGDEGVLEGYARLWRGFPLVLGISGLILGFVYESYFMRGAGTSLYYLFGEIGNRSVSIFVLSALVAVAAIFLVLSPNRYAFLEVIARIAVVVLIGTFFAAAIIQGVDFVGLVGGLSFGFPDNVGVFGSMIVVVSLIGAVGGSAANLLYPYFMRDKGWRGPRYRKLQRFDLLTGIASIIIINLAIWVVAAETMGSGQMSIASEEDLATMMQTAVGSFGPTILWVGLFFVVITSIPAFASGFAKLFVDSIHHSFPSRGSRYESPEADPILKPIMIVVFLVLPLVFALPFAPNLVILTVLGSSFAVLTAPIIMLGIILLTSSRRFMLPEFVNKWWQTAILVVVGGIGLWAVYGLVVGLSDTLRNLAG